MTMLNLAGMVRAPEYDWEVHMNRKRSLNAAQNARRRVAYVRAPNADEAKKLAGRKNPEFLPVSARRAS